MKRIFSLILFLMIASFTSGAYAESIRWMTQYDQAVKEAKASQKPLLLYFTGSDWCPWCKKLDSEALATPEFAQIAGDKFIFVKLLFSSTSKGEETEQNKQLQQRFNVRGFPTIILLDTDQRQIGITGYRAGGGKEYANHLIKMVQDYSGYKEKMGTLNKMSTPDLKSLYDQAQGYHHPADLAAIIEKGMQSEDSSFFILASIRQLAAVDKLDTKEAALLWSQLLEKDPDNQHQTHYHLAVIEFERRYSEMKKRLRSVESTIEPLVAYLEKFGKRDTMNAWRVNIIISQTLFDQNKYEEALKYAKQSFNAAPEAFQGDIAEAISDINNALN